MAKIIISAQIDVDPVGREKTLLGARSWIAGTLAEPGCIHYDWSADLDNLARIHVFEEWESAEALAGHFAGSQVAGMVAHLGQGGMQNVVSRKYRVDAEGPVYNSAGEPSPVFD